MIPVAGLCAAAAPGPSALGPSREGARVEKFCPAGPIGRVCPAAGWPPGGGGGKEGWPVGGEGVRFCPP